VEQAKATLAAAQAQLSTIQQNRAQLEHGLAVLLGRPPEGFSLTPTLSNWNRGHTRRPASDMLERRPDVAASERRVAAQNAQIGVAIAAYFPWCT